MRATLSLFVSCLQKDYFDLFVHSLYVYFVLLRKKEAQLSTEVRMGLEREHSTCTEHGARSKRKKSHKLTKNELMKKSTEKAKKKTTKKLNVHKK